MYTNKSLLLSGLIALLIIVLAACAPPEYRRQTVDKVWPLPPEIPRIKYVDYFTSSLDVGKTESFASSVFGEEKIDAFTKPYGVAVDKAGSFYVTDVGRVWVVNLQRHDYYFLGQQTGTGQLRVPIGIAVASDGRVFVTDVASDRVYVYLNGGLIAALGHEGEFISASGVALDEKRQLVYVTDSNKHVINVYSLKDYHKIKSMGKRGNGEIEFNFPTNIALDSKGNLYVVDTGNFRVQIIDPEGRYVRSFGGLGDTMGSFTRPKGIAIDSEDNIYVVDAAFQNIQIWNKEGQYLMAFGDGGIQPGQFSLPAGIAIDNQDKIYVVDQFPPRVQIFQYMGAEWKKRQEGGR